MGLRRAHAWAPHALTAPAAPPQIGPLGLSPKKVGEDIAKETLKDWKGLRVTVKLTVQNRQAKVSVVPSAAALVIKALKEPYRDRKKASSGRGGGGTAAEAARWRQRRAHRLAAWAGSMGPCGATVATTALAGRVSWRSHWALNS
jgi:hypothetical protein